MKGGHFHQLHPPKNDPPSKFPDLQVPLRSINGHFRNLNWSYLPYTVYIYISLYIHFFRPISGLNFRKYSHVFPMSQPGPRTCPLLGQIVRKFCIRLAVRRAFVAEAHRRAGLDDAPKRQGASSVVTEPTHLAVKMGDFHGFSGSFREDSGITWV